MRRAEGLELADGVLRGRRAVGDDRKSRVDSVRSPVGNRSPARDRRPDFISINWRTTSRRATRARQARARLFHEPGRLRAGLRAGRRDGGHRRRSERGESCAAHEITRERNELNVSTGSSRMCFNSCARAEKAEAQFDLIILDPPSFTKTKADCTMPLRGYRRIARARVQVALARRIARDVFLFASCDAEVFAEMIAMRWSMRGVPRDGCAASSKRSIIPCCRHCRRRNISKGSCWK